MKKTAAILAAACALSFGACRTNLDKYPKEKCAKPPSDAVVKAVHDNCIKCHTRDFTTKEDICSRKSMIIDSVSSGRMPKLGKLYDHYRETLVKWK